MKIILLVVCFAIGETISARLERSTGGESIMIEQASFFVSTKNDDVHKCGGALITGRHVLTAIVCVLDSSNELNFTNVVVTGSSTKYWGGTQYEIASITEVENTFSVDRQFNLAVIELPNDVFMSVEGPFIRPLPIGQPSFNTMANFYAFKSVTNPRRNTVLQKLSLTLYPHYQLDDNGATIQMMHAFQAFHKNCRIWSDDTGGPLVYKGSLVGIASPIDTGSDYRRLFIWIYNLKSILEQVAPTVKILN